MQSQFRYLRDNCTGATIPHISRPVLESIKIPLPPLSETEIMEIILTIAIVTLVVREFTPAIDR